MVDHAVDSPGLNVATAGTAAWLSLVAYVRHTFTDYDELLREGYDQESARHFVTDEIGGAIERALKADRPVVIDVVSDIEALAPLAVS